MKTFYKISDFFIQCDHQNDPLFKILDDELAQYRKSSSHSPLGVIQFFQIQELPALPLKARLTGKWHSSSRKEYALNDCKYWYFNDYALLAKDHQKRLITVHYKQVSQELEAHLRNAMKWLVIKINEDAGYAYVHGAALNYRGKNVLFTGDSGSGKSSCLLRIRKAGGRVISDDALLIQKNRPIPFTLKISVRRDYEKRFGADFPAHELSRISLASPEVSGTLISSEEELSGIDMIIFPKIWNFSKSQSTSMSSEDALQRLRQIYYKEALWNAYPASEEQLIRNYSNLVSNAKCHTFFAGSEESEVRESLLKLIGNDF